MVHENTKSLADMNRDIKRELKIHIRKRYGLEAQNIQREANEEAKRKDFDNSEAFLNKFSRCFCSN